MKTIHSLLLSLCLGVSQSFSGVLTFEEFQAYVDQACCDFYEVGHATAFLYGEENRSRYGGVTWDSAWLFGDEEVTAFRNHSSDFWCTDSDMSFLHPHSGHLSLFNLLGSDNMGFSTTQILTGAWFGEAHAGGSSWRGSAGDRDGIGGHICGRVRVA